MAACLPPLLLAMIVVLTTQKIRPCIFYATVHIWHYSHTRTRMIIVDDTRDISHPKHFINVRNSSNVKAHYLLWMEYRSLLGTPVRFPRRPPGIPRGTPGIPGSTPGLPRSTPVLRLPGDSPWLLYTWTGTRNTWENVTNFRLSSLN